VELPVWTIPLIFHIGSPYLLFNNAPHLRARTHLPCTTTLPAAPRRSPAPAPPPPLSGRVRAACALDYTPRATRLPPHARPTHALCCSCRAHLPLLPRWRYGRHCRCAFQRGVLAAATAGGGRHYIGGILGALPNCEWARGRRRAQATADSGRRMTMTRGDRRSRQRACRRCSPGGVSAYQHLVARNLTPTAIT